jgi:hypothetical protein
MKSPSRTYDISVVRSCRCLGISLPGSILSRATAGPKDCSLFKTVRVAFPLVFGNGAGIDSIFEASTICVELISFSLLFVPSTPKRQRKRSRAWNTCRLIIKSDKLADLQNSRRPEVFYRSVVPVLNGSNWRACGMVKRPTLFGAFFPRFPVFSWHEIRIPGRSEMRLITLKRKELTDRPRKTWESRGIVRQLTLDQHIGVRIPGGSQKSLLFSISYMIYRSSDRC